MSSWSKRQRFNAILSGKPADRPLISGWRHFIDSEYDAESLAKSMIQFQGKYDWDFVKINPRATYYAEIWGNTYDMDDYEGVVPKVSSYLIHDGDDLSKVVKHGTNSEPINEQLEAIKLIREGLGEEVPIIQTIFSPLAILEYLCGHRTVASNRPFNRSDNPVPKLMKNHREEVHAALKNITLTMIEYVQATEKLGVDGYFYAAMGLARDGYLTEEEHDEFARTYDVQLLDSISSPTIIHTCGPEANPERFTNYPIQAIHWADRSQGNPAIKSSDKWIKDKVAIGGVDESLFVSDDNQAKIVEQSAELIKAMKNKPFILTPGCGLPLDSTPSNIRAFRSVVDEG